MTTGPVDPAWSRSRAPEFTGMITRATAVHGPFAASRLPGTLSHVPGIDRGAKMAVHSRPYPAASVIPDGDGYLATSGRGIQIQ